MDLPLWYATYSAVPRARSLHAAAQEARNTARWLVDQSRARVQQNGDHAQVEPELRAGSRADASPGTGTPSHEPIPPSEAGARASLRWLYGSSPTPSPPACAFRIASDAAEPTEVVVRVSGEIDMATSVPLADTLTSHLLAAEPGACVLLDLGTVTFIDARGLRVLLEATTTARARGAVLAIIECPPCLSRLIKLTHTDDLLNVC